MALPTIDLSTILRIGISKALVALKSPLTIVLAFSTVLAAVGTALIELFTKYEIPQIALTNQTLPSLGNLYEFILYMANLNQIELILNSIISIFELLVPFSLLFFGSFFVGLRVYNISIAGRNTLKESVGSQ